MNRITTVAALTLTGLALAGCASQRGGKGTLVDRLDEMGYERGEQVEEIMDYRVNGWNYVDRQHVILNAGPSRDYLLSLSFPCNNLFNAESIGFTSTGNRLTTLDKLVVHQGSFTDNCPITSIHRVSREPSGTE